MAQERIPRSSADEFCQKLKPQGKPIYIRDSQVKGLVCELCRQAQSLGFFATPVKEGDKWREEGKDLALLDRDVMMPQV